MKTYTTRIMRTVIEIVTAFIIAALLTGIFFGAVLQTSYRLCPLTAEEVSR